MSALQAEWLAALPPPSGGGAARALCTDASAGRSGSRAGRMKERLRALGQAHVCFGLSPYQHWEFRKKNSPTHHHGRDSEVLLCFFCPVLRVSWEGPSCRRRRVVRRPPGECSGLSDTNSLGGKAAPCALPSGTMPLGGMAHIDRLNKNYPRGVGSTAHPPKFRYNKRYLHDRCGALRGIRQGRSVCLVEIAAGRVCVQIQNHLAEHRSKFGKRSVSPLYRLACSFLRCRGVCP